MFRNFCAAMEILLYVLGAAALALGIAGVVLPAIPGSALLVLGAFLVGWAEGFTRVSGWTVAACAAIGVAIWVVDFAAGILGARAFGASGEGHVRCCYATSFERLRVAMTRMEEYVNGLAGGSAPAERDLERGAAG